MPYYDTIEEDIDRAKKILKEGSAADESVPPHLVMGGTIYGKDIAAAYRLLESFVQEIEFLRSSRFEGLQTLRNLSNYSQADREYSLSVKAFNEIENILTSVRK